jgi:hypothetical protein
MACLEPIVLRLSAGRDRKKIIEINPKNVTYQLFGTPNTSGTISFLDGNSQPQTANVRDGR